MSGRLASTFISPALAPPILNTREGCRTGCNRHAAHRAPAPGGMQSCLQETIHIASHPESGSNRFLPTPAGGPSPIPAHLEMRLQLRQDLLRIRLHVRVSRRTRGLLEELEGVLVRLHSFDRRVAPSYFIAVFAACLATALAYLAAFGSAGRKLSRVAANPCGAAPVASARSA